MDNFWIENGGSWCGLSIQNYHKRDENGKLDSKRVETKNGYDDAIDQTVNRGFIVYTVYRISNTEKGVKSSFSEGWRKNLECFGGDT